MDQYIPQEEVRRRIISDMVKKRSSIVFDPRVQTWIKEGQAETWRNSYNV